MRNVILLVGTALVLTACSNNSNNNNNNNDNPAPNQAPTAEPIADQTISANVSSEPIAVRLSDDTTSIANLGVTASSDNDALIPSAAIVIETNNTGRTLVITPSASMTGSATIALTVTDEQGAEASTGFLVTVNRQLLSYRQTLRNVFSDEANALPRDINSLNLIQDAEDDAFDDLL